MVSKKFGDLLVSAELEEDEMWRQGTIRIDFEKGDLVDSVFVSPPLVRKFRRQRTPILDLVECKDWAMSALEEAGALISLNDDALNDLVWDLIEQKTTFTFWVSGLTLVDMEEICDEHDLDWEDLRESLEARFTKDGHPCGIDSDDPFHNSSNRLNPRNTYE